MDALSAFLATENASQYNISTPTEAFEFVQAAIAAKATRFVIFGKKECAFCQRAKRLLDAWFVEAGQELTYNLIDLNTHDAALVQPVLQQKTNQTTVPNIFYEGKHVGGYDDLCKLMNKLIDDS